MTTYDLVFEGGGAKGMAFVGALQEFEARGFAYGRLLELEPWREETHRQLMEWLAQNGQRSAAFAQYELCCRALAEELDVEPAPETVELYKRIQRGDVAAEVRESGRISQTAVGSDAANTTILDWGEAPLNDSFFGREAELAQLKQWLVDDQCRLVSLLGVGGVGKTSLAVQLIKLFVGETLSTPGAKIFDRIIWRSLLNAPMPTDIFRQLLLFLSAQPVGESPTTLDEQLRLLLQYLRQQRCLLILDNVEGIMQSKERAGYYRPGYEAYGQLFQRIAQSEHQSCLLLTSREQPSELQHLGHDNSRVRTLRLGGLSTAASYEILETRELASSNELVVQLVERYSGHPLALKLVAETIQDLYAGDVSAFLDEETLIFDDIRDILDQQFARLSEIEQEFLIWLAIEREAIATQTLWENLVLPPSKRFFLEALRSLQRRSLLEKSGNEFSLQNVITEYLTDRLIDESVWELETGQLRRFRRHSLMKATAKEHVRQSQIRLILQPIAERIVGKVGQRGFAMLLHELLGRLRAKSMALSDYAGGNILNLLIQLGIDLQDYDFSGLSIREADLRHVSLPGVNFAFARLVNTVFTDSFSYVHSVAVSPDGSLFAASSESGDIRIWRTVDGQLYRVLENGNRDIESIAFSPDGSLLAGGRDDHLVKLWHITSGRCLHTLCGHISPIKCVVFTPDGSSIASGGNEQTIHVWSADTGQLERTFNMPMDQIFAIAFSPDGQKLVCGGSDETVRIWEFQTGKEIRILRGHTGPIRSVAFSRDGNLLVTSALDSTVGVNSG